jgi:crotonobetainyl-CoA:carnitine CoA-transferase CaiB-like acyl-CoA transferase
LTIVDDAQWRALVTLLGDPPALQGAALEAVAERHRLHDQIDAAISAWTMTQDKHAVFHRLQAAGIPAGPVLDEADAASDPHLRQRGFFHVLEHPSAGTHPHPGANFQLTGTPTVLWRAAPVLGQDNAYVYRDVLGVTDDEWDALVEAGHIGDTYA